ncbi:MAG: NAD-dependent DNA ligase LigA, partial [Verrucomicrobia bacterium]|nr:NAD-dependent DNA ligase LigA [Verrucomicrobiota bacterium]
VVGVQGQVDVRCVNPECPEQVRRRLEHFAHKGALDIEGLGEVVVGQLVQKGLVRRIDQIYELSEGKLAQLERMGRKSISNLLNGIQASKRQPLWRLIFGLGILHVGSTAARELANFFGTMDALANASLEQLCRVPNTGEVVASSISDWFQNENNRSLIAGLKRHDLNFGESDASETSSNKLQGTAWVITGTLGKPRGEIEQIIRRNGGRVSGNLSRKTDYLLVGNEAGSKLEKANKLGVKIIDEMNFWKMIEGKS